MSINKVVKFGRLVPIWSDIKDRAASDIKNAKFYYLSDPEPKKEVESSECTFHDWQIYRGFTENYKFCKFCDKKEEL